MQLRAALGLGPAAAGWDSDQRWTLARIATLVSGQFGVSCTLRGASYLLHRATGRDEAKIAEWRSQTWAKVRG